MLKVWRVRRKRKSSFHEIVMTIAQGVCVIYSRSGYEQRFVSREIAELVCAKMNRDVASLLYYL